ncbi:ubiquitin carboxyl-terminal hydrolase 14-like [Corticium candelabrum]|uniref:ubiquitin carboxyl-terminal hydrolase 14-like n=1 Tax=Corticium candelabrum TaxID=121492 RepID=UPI002E25449E|nr:ubiquitin carboxyl-terminal hydrolase 14-like [Corticium candelabrum]
MKLHETSTVEYLFQLGCYISQVWMLQTCLQVCCCFAEVKYMETGLRSSRVQRLPAYLTIQLVRFFYKEKERVNAKILKDVKFPLKLNMFEFKEGSENKESNEPITMEVDEAKIEYEPYSFDDDVGSNNSGYYELNAILAHKGRSSSSGHYVAWVRRSGAYWIMFDDDKVSPVHEEDVVKLSGGGDWHSAYVLLYAPRRLKRYRQDITAIIYE